MWLLGKFSKYNLLNQAIVNGEFKRNLTKKNRERETYTQIDFCINDYTVHTRWGWILPFIFLCSPSLHRFLDTYVYFSCQSKPNFCVSVHVNFSRKIISQIVFNSENSNPNREKCAKRKPNESKTRGAKEKSTKWRNELSTIALFCCCWTQKKNHISNS